MLKQSPNKIIFYFLMFDYFFKIKEAEGNFIFIKLTV